ncbi:MAG: hypothetical protein KAR38_17645, partial [Calditrichia bacterium]|nr:hypothetical protein [Calditrichia bacterium]
YNYSVNQKYYNMVLVGKDSIVAANSDAILVISNIIKSPKCNEPVKWEGKGELKVICKDETNENLYFLSSGEKSYIYLLNRKLEIIDSLILNNNITEIETHGNFLIAGDARGTIFLYDKQLKQNKVIKKIELCSKNKYKDEVISIIADKNKIFYTVDGAGVFFIADYNKSVCSEHLSYLGNQAVHCLVKDKLREGAYWVGSQYDGAKYFNENGLIKEYTTNDGLISVLVKTIFPDNMGRIWFGTQFGLSAIKNVNVQNFFPGEHITDKVVWSTAKVNNELWVGSEKGIHIIKSINALNPKIYRPAFLNILKDETIFNILHVSDKSIWITTQKYGEIYRYKNDKWLVYTVKDGIPNSMLTKIFEDSKGRIWIGASKMVYFYNNRFHKLKMPDGMIKNSSYDIAELPNGSIIYGYQNGVFSFDGKTVSKLTGTENVNIDVSCLYYDKVTGKLLISA